MEPTNVWPAGMSYQQMSDAAEAAYGSAPPMVNLGLEYDPGPPALPVAKIIAWGAGVLALYFILDRSA